MASAPLENPETAEAQAPREEAFTFRQRLLISFVTWLGYLGIRLICPTLRWSVSSEDGGPVADEPGMPVIYTFWHRCVFLATHHYRRRGIVVMTSSSFDGEYIARIIEKFGYGAARGSSTRGGVRALLALHKDLEAGRSVAFTIDGPKGPRYVAKPGPTLLARNTQAPILCFHIAVDRAWILNTWDQFIIPKPFARAVVRVGRLIRVPKEADSAALDRYHAEMQQTLDRIREQAEKQASD
jgi:lysophospholipid acyltransferase (LPLAT)-like uncharacterized protein